jgi:hypothetical protein
MLAGGSPMPTGRKAFCPEHSISAVQFGRPVASVVGLPSVVTVVARVVFDVLEEIMVDSIRVREVDVAVLVLFVVDVNVDPSDVILTTSLTTDRLMEVFRSGKVATVVWVIILSMVVVGTDSVWVVVVELGISVALVNGANVVRGSSVEFKTEGKLVGNGGTPGCPPVSKVVCIVSNGVR